MHFFSEFASDCGLMVSVVRFGYRAPRPGNNVIAQLWARINIILLSWKTAQ
jgi:hypothetical protein